MVGNTASRALVVGFCLAAWAGLFVATVHADPVGLWEFRGTIPGGPRNMPGVAALDGNIYIAGGSTGGEAAPHLSRLDVYHVGSSNWTSGPDMNTARYALGMAACDGALYAIGGGTDLCQRTDVVERYVPGAPAWIPDDSKKVACQSMGVATVGEKIYTTGGDICADSTPATEEFTPCQNPEDPFEQGTWLRKTDRAVRGIFRSAAAAFDGRMFVFGGWDESGALSQVAVYDPATDTWQEDYDTMPSPLIFHGVCSMGNYIYVAGGTWNGQNSESVSDFWQYDPDPLNKVWTPLPDIPRAANRVDLVTTNGRLFLVDSLDAKIYEYVPEPSTVSLLALGSLAVMRRRRDQKR